MLYTTRFRLHLEALAFLAKAVVEKKAHTQPSAMAVLADVFISYSSKDETLCNSAKTVLEHSGAHLAYSAHTDPAARKLKPHEFGDQIYANLQANDRLVVLLTSKVVGSERESGSRWVPWELGVSHGLNGPKKTAVWPVVDTDAQATSPPSWVQSEYINIYPSVRWVSLSGTEQFGVRNPDTGHYWTLRQWLNL